jgi:bile acid:Na+ symporter, BASS family
MTLAKLIVLALQVSIFLTVFTLGLQATFAEAFSLWRRPAVLLRSLTAMFVIMPIFAVFIARRFSLDPSVEVALLLLAASPVPPVLPSKGVKVGAHNAYVFGLLVETALLSVVITPIVVILMGRIFGRNVEVSPAAISFVIAKTVLLPLALGLMFARLWPGAANRIRKPLGTVCSVVLVAASVLLLVGAREQIGSVVSSGTIVAIAAFCVVGLVVGQWLGGRDREDSTFLAIATASRHPGVAVAVAQSVAADPKLVIAAVLLYLLVNLFVGAPYSRWRKGGSPAAPAAHPLPHPSR